MTHELTTCLWYDGKAKEAAEYYCSIFKDSKITSENPMVVTFEINGSKFMGLNGGPMFSFNEAVSFIVTCDTQEEIDMYWNKLIANGGNESMCGWLKDKYGMSWQIVPGSLGKLMSNPAKGERVMQALLKMKKLDLKVLEEA
ncbi:MAG: VOC family protein [Bacteroidetes bacterium]|nr:VOC family protein [Bacteroidota bacterium]MBK9415522.1 VOC family protein [Bacteroidota bacterium]MBP6427402.1 VOC family protein [Bacteroidia bacterium]